MIVAGPSRCGKTTFVGRLLAQAGCVMTRPPGKVVYYYSQWQPLLAEFVRRGLVQEAVPMVPTVADVRRRLRPEQEGMVIVDDFMKEANADLGYMFTALSHHHRVSVVFLTQNLFSQHGPYRDMSLSATYIVCFKNPRDGSQMWHFARQFRPDRPSFVVEGFRAATRQPFSYVLFDFHPETADYLRMRARVLPDDDGPLLVVGERKRRRRSRIDDDDDDDDYEEET